MNVRENNERVRPRPKHDNFMWKALRRFKNEYPRLAKPFVTAWHMMRDRGITKRWLMTTFTVVIALLLVALAALTLMLRSYYYNGIEQGLRQRSAVTVSYFRSTLTGRVNSGNSAEYFDAALSFIETFDGREKMELQFLDSSGDVIASSTGFPYERGEVFEDYYDAISAQSGVGAWAGRNENGEHVIALTRLVSKTTGTSAGAVRYVVSLEAVDNVLVMLSLTMIGIILFTIFLMLLSGSYFVNSIVEPVKQITSSANRIAQGDFDIRLQTGYDDEIGALVSAINTMAGELASTEKLKNDFISTVSHELRTPLTAIKGWGETLRDCGTGDEALTQRGMNIIISESERMCSLVEDLLDFSAVQSGRMKLQTARIDIVDEIAQTVCLFEERCVQEHRELIFDPPEEFWFVNGDASRLRQVFVNIIDNAIKYTEDGGRIEITVRGEGNMTAIAVSDNGCGIAADDLKRVSKRFYKANMSKRGFGIGLALAEEITELHHGRLSIESAVGKGTTVTVFLPLAGELPDSADIIPTA